MAIPDNSRDSMAKQRRLMGLGRLLLGAGLVLAAAACTHAPNVGASDVKDSKTGTQQVTGTLLYRERLILRPGAVAEVSLLDVSRADAPARTIAQQVIRDPSAPPIPFVLEYNPADTDQRMSYAVRAVIRQHDQLLFTTDTVYPVITRGAGHTVDLLLKRVGGPTTRPDASLTETYWKLVSVAGQAYRHAGANREPHLMLRTDGNAVTGFGGCNTFTGRFEQDASVGRLRFDQLAATQRACLDGMDIEARFLAMLQEANRYVIQGDALHLLRNDEVLLRFEAVYF
jgi:putative lipoprotein